ncbi:uncharacterized protein LOC119579954 [Penaeus monodon]|uniref:uncharacterized protein LOC119579954 n=1 Tax=Penaeus monodon TaxID=6687 RepID=UPI0018A7569A|nr:uncharacterized protein LOC119579954 [Penaeus monodon]
MLWFLVASILLLQCATAAGDILRGVDVPLYAFAGGQATLSCSFDLRSTRLYSLKWYHNGTEFYRYVPTQRQQISIKPSPKFAVHELFRSDQRVTLSLTKLSVSASGQYRCEVIAEHPSFRTEASTATMTVLREPLSPPVLVGGKEIYEATELIKIGCQPRRPFHGAHTPTLQWFLEGSKVESEWVAPYGGHRGQAFTGLALHVPGEQVARAGGSLQAECRLTLGPHEHSTFKTLRVRIRMISYVENYQSSAPYGDSDRIATSPANLPKVAPQ